MGPMAARSWAAWATRWLPALVGVAVLVSRTLVSLAFRLALACVLALLTAPARWIVGSTVGWADRGRLAMVAMTPSILIDAVLVFAARAIETSPGTWISLGLLDLAVLGWVLSATKVGLLDPATPQPGEGA
jgi:hypothetical protein